MDIVTPIVVRVPQKTSSEMGVYIVHLLLPAEYQDNPPTPTDDNVSYYSKIKLSRIMALILFEVILWRLH